jgi:hypothetical protein
MIWFTNDENKLWQCAMRRFSFQTYLCEQASLIFPGAESYNQTSFQSELIAVSDNFFGLVFAFELVAHLAVYSPRGYLRDWQALAEFSVVMLFGIQSAIESGGRSLPFHPFLLRLVRMVRPEAPLIYT